MNGKPGKIGLVGCGTIGSYLYRQAKDGPDLEVVFLHDARPEAARALDPELYVPVITPAHLERVNMVVEAAGVEAVATWAPLVLQRCDMVVFSAAALADPALCDQLTDTCRRSRTRLYIPHGAILGLDGIADARSRLEQVAITTVKNPRSLGRSDGARTVVFKGPTREACRLFPRNTNVHAALALAGIGFDRTHSVVISDPATEVNTHFIEATGPDFRFTLTIESRPVGQVTGAYTPESAYQTVRRILVSPQHGLVVT